MASTSDLFAQALAQFTRGGGTPSSLNALASYDPSAALNTYAQGAYNTFNQGFQQNLTALKGQAAGAGRLKTGFYDQDVGTLAKGMGSQEQNAIAGQAMNAAGLQESALGTATGYAEDEQNRYLDLLSGQLDREQARKNQVSEQQGSLMSGIGSILGTGAGLLLSSERFKDDVEPLDNASDRLAAIPGRRFTYKGDDQPQVGVMAEDVDRAMPEAAVHDDSGRPAGVDYLKLVPLLIEASREQGDEIARLKAALRQGQPTEPAMPRSYQPAEVM